VTELLSEVDIGEEVVVQQLREGGLSRRLLDLGLVSGTAVKVLKASPFGDPRAYLIRGAVIALRQEDTAAVIVARSSEDD
jgi:ferrous iron transport protein A